MSDLPNLARSLHSSRKLTPAQIRNRTGFLDSNDRPLIALETIQGWLADTQAPPTHSEARPSTASISDQPKPVLMAAMPPKTWLLDPAGQDIVAQHLRRCRRISHATDQGRPARSPTSPPVGGACPPNTQSHVLAPGFPRPAILRHRSWSRRTTTANRLTSLRK